MHDMRVGRGTTPVFLVSLNVHGLRGPEPPIRHGRDKQEPSSTAHSSTTNPLTATALIYAFGAGITAGAGTRLVLQLLLDIGWV